MFFKGEGVMQNSSTLLLSEVTNVTMSICCGHFVWLSPMLHYGCKCEYIVKCNIRYHFCDHIYVFLVYAINYNQCLFLIRCLVTNEFDNKSLLNQSINNTITLHYSTSVLSIQSHLRIDKWKVRRPIFRCKQV